MVRSKKKNGLG